MLNRGLIFIAALCLGSMLAKMHIPIPFLLGGVLAAISVKTCAAHADISWPKLGVTML